MDGLTKKEVDQKQAERFTRIFGNAFTRLMPLENDLDDYYSIIKEAKKMDGYLARALSQIIQKALKNGWSFRSKNQPIGAFIDYGLYKQIRHPNYLGEILVWVSIFWFVRLAHFPTNRTFLKKELPIGAGFVEFC